MPILTNNEAETVAGALKDHLEHEAEVLNDCYNYELSPDEIVERATEFNKLRTILHAALGQDVSGIRPYDQEAIDSMIARVTD